MSDVLLYSEIEREGDKLHWKHNGKKVPLADLSPLGYTGTEVAMAFMKKLEDMQYGSADCDCDCDCDCGGM